MSTITDLSVVDVFDRAERAVAKFGLCQGNFCDPATGGVCTDGAVRYAITGRPDILREDMTVQQQVQLDGALFWLISVVVERYGEGGPWAPYSLAVSNWNDEPGRTQDEVLDVLRAARKLAGGAS